MKIFYNCAHCGAGIDVIEVDQVDEVKFGFDCLTAEERQDIIKVDVKENTMHVHSLCDKCIETLGLDEKKAVQQQINFLH
ncbi:anti-sigma-F factor Fin [Pelosinus fermentans]|uniref:Anti-sigma-F factor Fin family protein n=1 Tax=Pelosinus fermentans JBW45 TaxID=1192197 RepID=I9NSM3_9FIRM|nr:anti-sigma-F factor Fin [Pelosinus fermentans]AJQ29315.1 putative protein family YabK [Pelosinus fermentans JBW45]